MAHIMRTLPICPATVEVMTETVGASAETEPPDPTESFVSFGEQGAQLTYGSYLRLGQLLDSQRLQSDPPAHDELLFITVHQVYELWFKQLLFELESIRDLMAANNPSGARHLLERVMTIEEVAITQIRVLETMAPKDFLEFRQHLAPASGFQSVQFREIEFLSGVKDERYLQRLTSPDARTRLERR